MHTGTGTYDVRLPEVASPNGIAHVTPYRTVYRSRTCGVTGYAPDGPDQLVQVRCLNENSTPADWWFTVFSAAFGPGSTPYATVRYDDGAGGTQTVNPVLNSGTVNSGGGVNRVVREGVGRYRLTLQGEPFADGTDTSRSRPTGTGHRRDATRPGPHPAAPPAASAGGRSCRKRPWGTAGAAEVSLRQVLMRLAQGRIQGMGWWGGRGWAMPAARLLGRPGAW